MLSPIPRWGAGSRYPAGARAFVIFLVLGVYVAAAPDLSPGPSPTRGGEPFGPMRHSPPSPVDTGEGARG